MKFTIKKIAILLTCFNRQEKTLNCLQNLYKQSLPKGYKLDVYLVDDGSSDGTSKAVSGGFPEVKIIQGTGDLFWGGGMLLAWQTAANEYDYDFYLWINDDTFLYDNAVETVILDSEEKQHKAIICGTTASAKDGRLTYGGRIIGNPCLLEPNKELKECKVMNGNFVLVPQSVYRKVGSLDPVFPHFIADNDYGLRAVKNDIKIYVASKLIGECETNDTVPKWRSKEVNFFDRIKYLYSPLGVYPRAFFIYEVRHFSIFQAIKHFVFMHIKLLFPI